MNKIHSAAIVLSMTVCACGTGNSAVSAVTNPSTLYKLDGPSSYAVSYDSRGRGVYLQVAPTSSAGTMKVCAEPPPDTSANLVGTVGNTTSGSAGGTFGGTNVNLGASNQNSATASSTVADVAQQTEVTLVLREALYRVCELNLNGVLGNAEAKQEFEKVMSAVVDLGQRDNVAKLVAAMGAPDLDANTRATIAQLIPVLTVGDAMRRGTIPNGVDSQKLLSSLLAQKYPDGAAKGTPPQDNKSSETPPASPGSGAKSDKKNK